MRIGIICEYNPFHNGHLYHLKKIKELFPNSDIVMVMSGNFTQRGDVSVINKWDKTDIALHFGIDLVVELPFVFATQSADVFAKASIEILNKLDVDYLVFGSESNDIEKLKKLAEIQTNNKKYDMLVKEYLSDGVNYPTALSNALTDLTGTKINTPNDILGITYIREILKLKSKIKPITIKRNNDYNCKELNDFYSSATSIRFALENNDDITDQVPEYTTRFLDKNLLFINNYFNLLKYNIIIINPIIKSVLLIIYRIISDKKAKGRSIKILKNNELTMIDNTNIGSVTVGLSGSVVGKVSSTTRASILFVFTIVWLVFAFVILINMEA